MEREAKCHTKYDWIQVSPSSPRAYKVAYFRFQTNYNGTTKWHILGFKQIIMVTTLLDEKQSFLFYFLEKESLNL
jgi:hypothetical protein